MYFFERWFDSTRRHLHRTQVQVFQTDYAQALTARLEFINLPGGTRVSAARELVRIRGLNVALAREPRVALVGNSGAGKTAALTHLALSYARAILADESDAPFPVFVSARDLQGALRVSDLLSGLDLAKSLAAKCPDDFFSKVYSAGHLVLLIDDIDVLTQSESDSLLREFSHARVVVSASASIPEFYEFPLYGFRDEDIEAYSKLRFGKQADAFGTALKANGVPRSLTSNPFTLMLLDQVWRADAPAAKPTTELHETYDIKPLPARRSELFDAFVRNVIGGDDEVARMLEGVALAMQRGRISPDDFLPKAKGFLRAGKNRTANTFTSFSARFVHDLWRDYFAARALRRAPDLTPLVEHLQEPRWRETVLFYAGLGDASELVNALIARGDFAFAGLALAHAKESRADLRENVTKELAERAWKGDEAAVRALAEMRSEVAVDGFASKLKDPDAAARARAVDILSQFQMDRSIEYLLTQLRDINPEVRDKVLAALGQSLSNRVIEPLLVSLRGDTRIGLVDTRMRIAAAKALGEVGSDKAVPALVVDLQLGEPEVRAVAAESLKRIASPLMIKPLKGVALTGDELARKFAADVLATLNGKAS